MPLRDLLGSLATVGRKQDLCPLNDHVGRALSAYQELQLTSNGPRNSEWLGLGAG